MGKLSGAILIVAGVTIAAYALSERQHTGADSAGPVVRAQAKASDAPGTGSPPQDQPKMAETPQPALTAPPAPPAAKSPEPQPQPLTGKLIPPPAVRIAEAPPRVPVDKNKPQRAAPLDREGLTKEIQRQLKRVGCYGGAITGVWSPAVRQSMKAFTDRVNATLPVEQPDQVLLALVQNHQQAICSAACPPGQAAAGNGRCLPNALVARAKKAKAPAKETKGTIPTPVREPADASGPTATPVSPPPGRMSLAGPPAPANRPARIRAHPKNGLQYRPAVRPSRYADTRRIRERRRAARAAPGPSGGMPWWAVPLFSP
jgi:hypothetical protein